MRKDSIRVRASGLTLEPIDSTFADISLIRGRPGSGKTTALNLLWLAYTGEWCGHAIPPDPKAEVTFDYGKRVGKATWDRGTWRVDWGRARGGKGQSLPFWAHDAEDHILAVYVGGDGSCRVWNPGDLKDSLRPQSASRTQADAWFGKIERYQGDVGLEAGLEQDLMRWARSRRQGEVLLGEWFMETLSFVLCGDEYALRVTGEVVTYPNLSSRRESPILQWKGSHCFPLLGLGSTARRISSFLYPLVAAISHHNDKAKEGMGRVRRVVVFLDDPETALGGVEERLIPGIIRLLRRFNPDMVIKAFVATKSNMFDGVEP